MKKTMILVTMLAVFALSASTARPSSPLDDETESAQTTSTTKPCAAKTFFITGTSTRLHYVFSCNGPALEICNARGVEIKNDCQYRGEDGGTPYTSCSCQAVRYVKECYEEAGCDAAFILEINPECFNIQ